MKNEYMFNKELEKDIEKYEKEKYEKVSLKYINYLEDRVKELESLTDRQTIALETTHSRLQVLEDKMYTVECNHPTGH